MTRTHDELVAEIAQLNEWLDAVIDERDQAAKRERAAIVDFLRRSDASGAALVHIMREANCIERGDHLREGDE